MITLLYADVGAHTESEFADAYLPSIDAARRAKAVAYKPGHAKILNVAAGCLMQVGARLMTAGLDGDLISTGLDGIASLSFDDYAVLYEPLTLSYTEGEFGKPFFRGTPDAFFSLSHSGDVAAVAIGEEEMGLDVQFHRPTHYLKIAERFFAAEEVTSLLEVSSGTKRLPKGITAQDVFHDLWAAKEAYVKFTGDGLFLPFDTFRVDLSYQEAQPLSGTVYDHGRKAFLLYPVATESYSFCLCTASDVDVRVLKVTFAKGLS